MKIKLGGPRDLVKRPLIALFLVAVIMAIYAHAALPTGKINLPFLNNAKLKFQDYYFKARLIYNDRYRPNYPKDSAVILVATDDESMLSPLLNIYTSAGLMAKAIESVSACSPKVIVYDLSFLNSVLDEPLEKDRAILIETIKKSGNVLMVCDAEKRSLRQIDRDILKAGLDYGRSDTAAFLENDVSRYLIPPGFEKEGQVKKIPLPIKAALLYWDIPINQFAISEKRDKIYFASETDLIIVPLNDYKFIPINYLYNKEMIPAIPIWKFLQEDFKTERLQGKIALIADTRTISSDRHDTPIGKMPGGLALANIINSFIHTYFLTEVPIKLHLLILTLLGASLAIFFYKNNIASGAILLLPAICLSLVISFILFLHNILCSAFDFITLFLLLYIGILVHKAIIKKIETRAHK